MCIKSAASRRPHVVAVEPPTQPSLVQFAHNDALVRPLANPRMSREVETEKASPCLYICMYLAQTGQSLERYQRDTSARYSRGVNNAILQSVCDLHRIPAFDNTFRTGGSRREKNDRAHLDSCKMGVLAEAHGDRSYPL